MKKLFALVAFAALGLFAVGCGGETTVTTPEGAVTTDGDAAITTDGDTTTVDPAPESTDPLSTTDPVIDPVPPADVVPPTEATVDP
ncbi:MAG: hypothetical protein WD872_13050 [Pirellulaceae bacterium]